MIAGTVETRSSKKATVTTQPTSPTRMAESRRATQAQAVEEPVPFHPAFRGMPLPPCPVFDSARTDPTSWLKDYELYSENFHCRDKMRQVRYFLDDECKRWYDTLQPETLQTWQAFEAVFKSRWDNCSSVSKFTRLNAMKQTTGQTVRSFITQIQH